MSASIKHRGARQSERKSARNKVDRHVAPPSTPPRSSSYSPWTPTAATAFKAMLSARLCAAIWSNISDCDEVYNYWEPLHYLMRGRGFQTWEYSPEYAIRSYAYVWLYALPLKIYSALSRGPYMLEFYFLRVIMAFCCTVCEIFFYRSVCRRYGNNVGRLLFCFLLMSTGMYISSTAFLPSSFSMYMTLLSMGAWFINMDSLAVFGVAASAILGWPFAAVLGAPMAWDMVVRQKKIGTFIRWSVISAALCLVPLVLIDSYYYGKLVVAPLNIVMYNVFSEHGPDIYGVEPWSFYFMNGFLNFNIVFPLALAVVPVAVFVKFISGLIEEKKSNKDHHQALPVWLCMAPMYIWMIIFFTRPHKEERFLFPIYPLFCLGGALALDYIQRLLYNLLTVGMIDRVHYTRHWAVRWLGVMFCILFITASMSRSLALYQGYHAPLDVFGDLTQIAGDPDHHDPTSDNHVNVCVGKEWYRFTSNFFMPNDRWKLQFLKSEFRGQLPKPYDDRPNATKIIPSHMNDRNLEESTRYVDVARCHYLIDLDLPGKSQYEPRYSQNSLNWTVVYSVDFVDASRSHKLFRSFYIPIVSEKLCIRAKYNLLQSTRYRKIKV